MKAIGGHDSGGDGGRNSDGKGFGVAENPGVGVGVGGEKSAGGGVGEMGRVGDVDIDVWVSPM